MPARHLVLALAAASLTILAPFASAAVTERVSISSEFSLGDPNGPSDAPSVNSDGRFVAFSSQAYNLVPGDTNGCSDIFVRDRAAAATEIISVSSSGARGDGDSTQPAISADGRFVAFVSAAANFLPEDTNAVPDVFVFDRQARTMQRVSVGNLEEQASAGSYQPAISTDGRYVAFVSDASNLVAGDTNGCSDIFLRDRQAGTTERVSLGPSDAQANGPSWWPAVSADARYVAFCSWATNLAPDANPLLDVFVRDRRAKTTELISISTSGMQGTAGACMPAISADGRYVAFNSSAPNLISDDTNALGDVFLRDRTARTTIRLSLSGSDEEGNGISGYGQRVQISADGKRAAFDSESTNLVTPDAYRDWEVLVRDPQTPATERAAVTLAGVQANAHSLSPAISGNGRYVAFSSAASNLIADDTNHLADIYLRDLVTGSAERVSVGIPGQTWQEANHISDCPTLSGDGRLVAFESIATNLTWGDNNGKQDIYLRDRLTRSTERVSVGNAGEQANGMSWWPALNGDGRYVVFSSSATNFVPGDYNGRWDIFVRDRLLGTTERVSLTSRGEEGDGDSARPGLSREGRYVAFESDASNFAPGDANGYRDLFLHDRETGATTLVSRGYAGDWADGRSEWPVFSADGRYLVFQSEASNLVPGDTNGVRDVFVCDLLLGGLARVSVNSTGEQGNGDCWWYPAITADGRYVAFESDASNLVTGDTNGKRDVFIHDRITGATERVSIGNAGEEGNGDSWGRVGMSDDGRYVTFDSHATNFVPDDTNGKPDVFVRDRELGVTIRASLSLDGRQGAGGSDYPAMSANGRAVAFESEAPDLVPLDRNGWWDVFVRDFLARFLDVPSFHWAFAPINACADADIVGGYPDGTYRPAEAVTRAQMAVYLARVMAGGEANVPDPGCDESPFPDVPCGYWARKYIQYVRDQGVASGYADGYHPEELVTRDQMAVFAARALAGGDAAVPDPGCAEPVFPDVDCGHWARKYVQFIKQAGVSSGYPDGKYHPEIQVTRDQMAVYIARGFALPMTANVPSTGPTWEPARPRVTHHPGCSSSTAISGGQ